MAEIKRIPQLDPVINYTDIKTGWMLAIYDLQSDTTLRMTVQQFLNVIQTQDNIGIFPPVQDLNALKNINTTDPEQWVNNGIINVPSLGLFQLDRNSNLTGNDSSVIAPNNGPGRWLLMFKNQEPNVVAYVPSKTYNNEGGLNSYAVYNLKYWEYWNATPTNETEREAIIADGSPQENIYWKQVSKADIDNLAGGDLAGTYPNPQVAYVDGGEI